MVIFRSKQLFINVVKIIIMMNKRITSTPEAPNNLPFDNGDTPEKTENNDERIQNENVSFSVSKKNLKTGLKILIILIILAVATPRIISNVRSTADVVNDGAEKFPTFFPSLSSTGSAIGSFFVDGAKNVSGFVTDNLAAVAELLYSRKIDDPTIDITPGVIEETAKPVKLIIDRIGVNTVVLNPESTDLDVLDENLTYGVVRYPKSGLLGENDNVYIFGHSTGLEIVRNQAYRALNDLEDLKVGDTVKIQSNNKEHLYSVTSVRTERDSQAVVKFNTGKRTLTISTCNTLGAKEDRHIVEADFIISYPLANTSGTTDNTNDDDETPSDNNNGSTNTGGSTTLTPGDRTDQIIPITPGGNIGVSNPYGQADLVPEIIEVGIIDPVTDAFVASSTPSSKSKIAFKFVVKNAGDKTVTGWTFNAVLPTSPVYIYHSNTQRDLRPGERIEYMLGFDKANSGNDLAIIVNVNPTGGTNESDKTNNIVKKLITIIE